MRINTQPNEGVDVAHGDKVQITCTDGEVIKGIVMALYAPGGIFGNGVIVVGDGDNIGEHINIERINSIYFTFHPDWVTTQD